MRKVLEAIVDIVMVLALFAILALLLAAWWGF